MGNYKQNDFKVFDLFANQWAVVTAGNMEKFNSCTVSWGSLGTIWTRPGKSGSSVTVYLYPTRLTREYMNDNKTFTVSFFPADQKKALGILGSRSGRDGDKVAASGLTPVAVGDSVGYEEASLTFYCRKIYQHQMTKEDLADDIQEYYAVNPVPYPLDENGEWHPHWVYIGEILDVIDREAN